jgi:hypothetical protein
MSKPTPVPPPSPDEAPEDDTEGHWYKWHVESDGKGGQRLRSTWTPNDSPQARTSQTATSAPKKPTSRS